MSKGFDDLIGSVLLERYKVIRRLGAGGMGAVYEVEHTAMATHHALKIMLAGDDSPRRATLQERFLREARLCARIRHPNLVMVTDFGFHDGHPTLVMDYVSGKDYSQIIRSEGPLTEGQALVTLSAVASALAVIHQQGVIHRDLKPANIMREDSSGRVIMMDLGIAKDLNDMGATMDIIGTPAYMPPEQAKDSSRVSAASDIYSLGATLVALLSGKAPIRGTSALQVMVKVQEQVFAHGSIFGLVHDLENRLSPKTAALIRDMTRYDPEDRIQDGMEVVTRLREILGSGESLAAEESEQVSMTLATVPQQPTAVTISGDTMPGSQQGFSDSGSDRDQSSESETVDSATHGDVPSSVLLAKSFSVGSDASPRKQSRLPLISVVVLLCAVVVMLGLVVFSSLGGSDVEDPYVREVAGVAGNDNEEVAHLGSVTSQGAAQDLLHQHQQTTPEDVEPTATHDSVDRGVSRAVDWPRAFILQPIEQRMLMLPPGRVRLGSDDPSHVNERPQVQISFTYPRYIAETTVTRQQYALFLSSSLNRQLDPGLDQFIWQDGVVRERGDGRLPVVGVTLSEARAFVQWLSEQTGLSVRLPSEAEWEYAARGPSGNQWPWGNRWRPDIVHADGRDGPAPVGSYPSGASWMGALDMAGNVFEWCDEWFDEERWSHISQTDPQMERSDSMDVFHVVRGGSFANPRHLCRGSFRIGIRGDDRQAVVGFRIVVEVNKALKERLIINEGSEE